MNYGFDVNVEERPLSDDEKVRKDVTTSDLERFTLLEEVSLRQKSRPLWLREGDKNTNFFHCVAHLNRKKNTMESLVNGSVSLDSS